MIDIQFIEFYIRKRYNQSMVQYFGVSKPVLSIWRKKSFPVGRMDEFIRREKGFDVHELFERIYKREG
jgi:hypothetical protein